ncbi:MAG: aminotransferase class I/II-fold pyridoxal phosphate-dependent enzyme [Acetobacteraceae bacterium]
MTIIRFEEDGRPHDDVVASLEAMRAGDADWRNGRVPLYVFSGPPDVQEIGRQAFNIFFTENALGARRAFPSLMRMEQEIVGMGLDLFHAPDGAAGNMTSGGTESIVMAVKACRDWSRARRNDPAFRGTIVLPGTAHPAFDKAAALMDLTVRRVPARADFRADVPAMAAAIDDSTIMLVGSAPCFPFGVIDPLEELSALALKHDVWLHSDACVGGWMAPFAAEIGRDIPAFDLGLPGVRSLSADLHKFGFCPKPSSVVFYRSAALQAHQEMVFDVWPSGRFATQTLVGTRAGGAVAGSWAVMRYLGRTGYRRIARQVLAMRDAYVADLSAIPGMAIRGTPELAIIAFGCDDIDMGKVATRLAERGWVPGMVRSPPSLHLMMSLHHEQARAAYVRDVAECVAAVRHDGTVRSADVAYS